MNELAKKLGQKLADMKADGVVIADVRNITPLTEACVVAGARSDRQLNGLKEACLEVLKELNHPVNHVEGRNGSKWIVVDCYEVVVHLFELNERERIKFDNIIAKCDKEELTEKDNVEVIEKPYVKHIDDRFEDLD